MCLQVSLPILDFWTHRIVFVPAQLSSSNCLATLVKCSQADHWRFPKIWDPSFGVTISTIVSCRGPFREAPIDGTPFVPDLAYVLLLGIVFYLKI